MATKQQFFTKLGTLCVALGFFYFYIFFYARQYRYYFSLVDLCTHRDTKKNPIATDHLLSIVK